MKKYLWVEKYRPATIKDCVLGDDLKKTFQDYVTHGDLPNLLLVGPAGTGKTTVAKALCNELSADHIIINSSLERNIDTLRNDVLNFASTMSLTASGRKVVILDEADNLNPSSVQPALRAFIEQFASNVAFILTANYPHKLLEPLRSRCTTIDFSKSGDPKELALKFFHRVRDILTKENIEFDNKVLAAVIKHIYPDFRKVLNELQRYGASGKIDSGILNNLDGARITSLLSSLKAKRFLEVRQWVAQNYTLGVANIIAELYNKSYEVLQPQCIPRVILVLNEGQKADAYVVDKEINLMATLTEFMVEAQFK